MKPWLITHNDISNEEAIEGSFVAIFVYAARIKKYRLEIGLISREFCEDQWVVNGEVRYKEQVLFVLNFEGYIRLLKISNTLAY